jgi:hypothetical protein
MASPRPAIISFSRGLLRAGVCFCLLLAVAPAGRASGAARETLTHQREGDHVRFALPERSSAVALQGLVPRTGQWVTLAERKRPAASLARLKVPPRWRSAELRVVATRTGLTARRGEIASQHDPEARSVTFASTAGARLFSIEAKTGAAPWTRVSTVAAPLLPREIRVALPTSLPAGTRIRVVAVSGTGRSFPALATRLATPMRAGPVAFAPTIEAVSSQPLASMAGPGDGVALASADRGGLPAAVEESDVWRVHGERIYFFNRLRGLQIINTADPSAPFIAGRLPMAGVGEEMYVIENGAGSAGQALLLTSQPWSPAGSAETQVRLVSLAGDAPRLDASLALPGHYVDSRLTAGRLHVVTRAGSWESPATFVMTIAVDGSGLLTEETRQTLPFEAVLVGSTGNYLWVAGESSVNWWQQRLAAFPFRVDGSLGTALLTEVGGRIQDKFKVGDTSEGLAVVVQNWSEWRQSTRVETYRAQADALAADATLELVRGESLFASRFDGRRLYAVTFQQVDPLWIVDLSDPSHPVVEGHLEVPGWSFFIQPMGDILLAVGRDGGVVQVSMFDVSDPARPSLVNRVDIAGGWSRTEAEWNEKALKILPEAGLMLVPVVESLGGEVSHRVALVEFDTQTRHLAERGRIGHDFEPRRAGLLDNGLVCSVANRELLLVDVSDRDRPTVPGRLTLAHRVDRIVVHEDTALLFENGDSGWSGTGRRAVLRTAPYDNPENAGPAMEIGCDRIATAGIFDSHLLVVEVSGERPFWLRPRPAGMPEETGSTALSVWSLANPDAPALLARIPLPFTAGDKVDLLPVEGGRVAVASRDRGWHYLVRPLPVLAAPVLATMDAPMMTSIARLAPPSMGWGRQRLNIAVVEIAGGSSGLLGTWELADESCTGLSEIFSAGDRLVFSFGAREPAVPSGSGFWPAEWTGQTTRHWLQVLDLADPASPMPWAPVQLPGELLGVSWLQRSGGTIFARSGDRVAAVGFDGESAAVVAEVPAAAVASVNGATLYFPGATGVEERQFSEQTRTWTRGVGWPLAASGEVNRLHVANGAVLAGGYNTAWVLGEDGSVVSHALPWGADLGAAAEVPGGWLVPAGDHGTLELR